MPPKKAAVSADPPPAEPSDKQKKETNTDAATLRKIADHPSVRNMVMEALKVLDSRKGVSNQAIRKYINQKWLMDPVRLRHFVRKELTKGLDNGLYVRPPGSTVTTGIVGKFRLASKTKTSKIKSENADPNVPKAPKVAKDGDKKPKKTGDKKEAASKEDKSEKPKPAKKTKQAEEASSSKPAPAKKPKAKKAELKKGEGASNAAKAKATKAVKKEKSSQSKAAKADSDAPVSKAPGKRGKKTAE